MDDDFDALLADLTSAPSLSAPPIASAPASPAAATAAAAPPSPGPSRILNLDELIAGVSASRPSSLLLSRAFDLLPRPTSDEAEAARHRVCTSEVDFGSERYGRVSLADALLHTVRSMATGDALLAQLAEEDAEMRMEK